MRIRVSTHAGAEIEVGPFPIPPAPKNPWDEDDDEKADIPMHPRVHYHSPKRYESKASRRVRRSARMRRGGVSRQPKRRRFFTVTTS